MRLYEGSMKALLRLLKGALVLERSKQRIPGHEVLIEPYTLIWLVVRTPIYLLVSSY